MATLETNDPNVLDAETVNWRLVVYPVLIALVVAVVGFGIYYYQLAQREALESKAREALLAAKTPQDMTKVADQFPGTDQQILALIGAGNASFAAREFPAAEQAYQRVIDTTDVDDELKDSAKVGLASAQEAMGKPDDALKTYLDVAHRGSKSPYAPYAYSAAARLYDERGDKVNSREVMGEEAGLDPESPFVKEAQAKLKALSAPQPPTGVNIPVSSAPAPGAK